MKIVCEFPNQVKEIENEWIALSDGTNLAARIWMPEDASAKPVPAILEYLPYRKRDGTMVRDELTHPYFAGNGYACVRVDMRGNGESDGLLFDEYTKTEHDDCLEVINWLVDQPWCDGNVGMMGISWGGFNSLQLAALQPEALKAIITLCSTVDRFNDDIHYKGGCLLNENLGWAGTMLSFSSSPPDPELVGDKWQDMWMDRLENIPHMAEVWFEHQTRDAYWKHGSVCEDYSSIKAAVLAVGGWGDSYKNAIPHLLENLQAPCKGIVGPWIHKYPHFAVPNPAIGFLQEALRWWDYWLKGIDTGVMDEPDYRVFSTDSEPPKAEYDVRAGRWISEPQWPSENVRADTIYLNEDGLGKDPKSEATLTLNSPQDMGKASGEYCAIWQGPELPTDQVEDDNHSLCFDGSPLLEDYEILGAPVVNLKLSIDQPQGNLYVRICDVDDKGVSERVSYGVMNLTHRKSNEAPEDMVSGELTDVSVKLDHCAHRFLKGQRIRVAISTVCWPLIWPSAKPVTLSLLAGQSAVVLPKRTQADQPIPVFEGPEGATPIKLREVRPDSHERIHSLDVESGLTQYQIIDDFGDYEDLSHGLQTGGVARENYEINANDPLTANAETHWTQTKGRGEWQTRVETFTSLRADAGNFYLDAEIEAYLGEELVFEKIFTRSIPRNKV